MQKKIALLLLAISAFSPFYLLSAIPHAAANFELLKKQGTLFFGFTPTQSAAPGLPQGHWQASVITPDGKTFKGPKINASKPHAYFRIKVQHPILRGTYRIVVENISVTNFSGSLTKPFVHVKTPSNDTVVNVVLTSQLSATVPTSLPNDPGMLLQGEFTPYKSFIFHKRGH